MDPKEVKKAIKLIKEFCRNFNCKREECPVEIWCTYFREGTPAIWEVEK
jgi:hypothetical protein